LSIAERLSERMRRLRLDTAAIPLVLAFLLCGLTSAAAQPAADEPLSVRMADSVMARHPVVMERLHYEVGLMMLALSDSTNEPPTSATTTTSGTISTSSFCRMEAFARMI